MDRGVRSCDVCLAGQPSRAPAGVLATLTDPRSLLGWHFVRASVWPRAAVLQADEPDAIGLTRRTPATYPLPAGFATLQASAAACSENPSSSTSSTKRSLPCGVSRALACCIPGLRDGREL